jgi:glycerol uptake facilitator-like aquaporin
VGAFLGAAYWFTSSTSFANPAITIGRMFSDTFAGIAPASVPLFIAMQLLGGVFAVVLIRLLYPDTTPERTPQVSRHRVDAPVDDAVLPHPIADTAPARD